MATPARMVRSAGSWPDRPVASASTSTSATKAPTKAIPVMLYRAGRFGMVHPSTIPSTAPTAAPLEMPRR